MEFMSNQTDGGWFNDALNLIEGTDERDNIVGTDSSDYIIAGGGRDFYVLGGDGADAFEVNYGDSVVRIADFVLGEDVVVLENQSVLDGASFRENGDRLDVVLEDGTLIRVNGVTEAEASDMFVFRSEPEPTDTSGPAAPADPPAPDAPHDPLASADMNLIEGTDERDAIRGTDASDYIIAGAGQDFYVLGGAGQDTFEVNLGDDVVRIADFQLGADVVALEDRSILDNATFRENGDRFDVILEDGTLIRVNGATADDVDDMFVFRSDVSTQDEPSDDVEETPDGPDETPDAPDEEPDGSDETPDVLDDIADAPDPEKILKIVIFGGQSLAFGATGRDWLNDEAQYSNSLMLDFDNPAHGARGWASIDVDTSTFNGFTPRLEVAQESPATGAMNVLAAAHPEMDFISLHYGQSGQSLDYIRENTLDGLFQQLELVRAQAEAEGYTIDPNIELVWIHGQSGSSGDYSETLSLHQDEVEAGAQGIFGADFSVDFYSSITRGFGGRITTGEQFNAIVDDPDIYLGATEIIFNTQYPVNSDPFNAHLTGEGYYMLGAQAGARILANMDGNPTAPIAVEAVTEVSANVYQIDFSGVQGSLQEGAHVFADDDFIGAPEHFGIDIYRINNGRIPGEIVSSRIIDENTIEIEFSEDLSGEFRLWIGRSESDGWIEGDRGAGYGGTTLFDTAQFFTAVAPADDLELQTQQLYEYVPQQYFDFWV